MQSPVNSQVRVVVVQRQTVDWAALDDAAFDAQARDFCRLWGKPPDYITRLRQLWDRTFAVGYLETRAALKQQALAQVAGVPGICFVPFERYTNLPDAALPYVFIDDDDWVAPDIARLIGEIPAGDYDAILGRAVTVGGPQQAYPVFVWGMNGRCMTNNYAISGVWLDHLQRVGEVAQHAAAAQSIARMSRVQLVDAAFSATNKSPCSSVCLDRGLAGDLQPARLVALVEQYLAQMAAVRPEHVHAVTWIPPVLAETVALFERVYASRFTGG